MNSKSPASFGAAVEELRRLSGTQEQPFLESEGLFAFDILKSVKKMPRAELQRRIAPHQPPTVFDIQSAPLQTDLARAERLADRILDDTGERFHRAGFTSLWTSSDTVLLFIAQGDRGLDFLPLLHSHFGGDEKRPHSAEEFDDFLRGLREEEPFLLRCVEGAALEITFLAAVKVPERLARTLQQWCCEITSENGSPAGIDSVVKRLVAERRVRLWWD